MKIVKEGKEEFRKSEIDMSYKDIECPKCSCVMDIDTEDWLINKDDYQFYVICPFCGEEIYKNCIDNIVISSKRKNNVKEKLIDKILDFINFENIHTAMVSLNWKWFDAENGIPSIDELKARLKDLMEDALLNKRSIGTGGFYVDYLPEDEYSKEGLTVRFAVESCTAGISNNGEIELF